MKCPTPGCDKEIDEKYFVEYISKEKEAAMKADALKEADKKIKEKEAEMKESAKKEAEKEADKKIKEKEAEMKKSAKKEAKKEADKKIKEKEVEMKESAKKEAKKAQVVEIDNINKKREIERKSWKKQVAELQKKLEHQEPELKGEAQEQQIEDFLKEKFPNDKIDVIKKGEKGADIIFSILNQNKEILDSIYIESKNVGSFQQKWLKKLFKDMKERNIEYGILVTKTLPGDWDEKTSYEQKENGIVILPMNYGLLEMFIERSIAILREKLNSKKNINVDESMKNLIEFFTGTEFKMHLRSIGESWKTRMENIEAQKKNGEKILKLIAKDENLLAEEKKDMRKMLLKLIKLGGPDLLGETDKTIESDDKKKKDDYSNGNDDDK